MTDTAKYPALAKALVQAQNAVKAVAKDGTNSFHRYKYATMESLIDAARGWLNSAGLALMPVGRSVRQSPTGGTEMHASFALVHSSGEMFNIESVMAIVPDKGRPQDKAEAATATTLLGYLLRDLLLIPREDEESIDKRDDREVAAPAVNPKVGELKEQIAKAATLADLRPISEAARAANLVPAIRAEYEAKFAEIKKAEAAGGKAA